MFIRETSQFSVSEFNTDYFIMMWELGLNDEDSNVCILGA